MPQSESGKLFELVSKLAVNAGDLDRMAERLRDDAIALLAVACRLQQEEANHETPTE